MRARLCGLVPNCRCALDDEQAVWGAVMLHKS